MRILFVILLFIIGVKGYAQMAPDSSMVAQGKIVNAKTKEPVMARIVYESLPYHNQIGILEGSSFSFIMFSGARYSITVQALGFATAKYMLDPAEAVNNILTRDIELTTESIKESAKPAVGTVIPLSNLIFEIAKAKIEPSSYSELDRVSSMMQEHPAMVIQLEGHTDFLGNPEKNMKLSEERVQAVKNYLITKGIQKSRVKTKAFGGTQPLSREDTPEAHRLNRRVELRVLKN